MKLSYNGEMQNIYSIYFYFSTFSIGMVVYREMFHSGKETVFS